MSTRSIICFISHDDLLTLDNEYNLNLDLIKDAPAFYKHSDGYIYNIIPVLSRVLNDGAIRRHDESSVAAWTLYEFMKEHEARVNEYGLEKLGYYIIKPLEYDLTLIDYFYLVVNGEAVYIYSYDFEEDTMGFITSYDREEDVDIFLDGF